MDLYSHFSPLWAKLAIPYATWQIPDKTNIIYLTFDDGPAGKSTDWILSLLKEFNVPATFFLIGKNVEEDNTRSKQMVASGHQIANHGFHHHNNLKLSFSRFKSELFQCEKVLNQVLGNEVEVRRWYRPPYGLIYPWQAWAANRTHRICMWDYCPGDFNPNFDPARQRQLWPSIKSGSIVVFHDNLKHFERLKSVLPDFLAYFAEKNYQFQLLPYES